MPVFDRWSVVVVPFPFVERSGTKRRPALVLSSREFNSAGATALAMITTATHRPWPGDTPITDHDSAGLENPCIVRLKLFTLDNRLLLRRVGQLGKHDRSSTTAALRRFLVSSG